MNGLQGISPAIAFVLTLAAANAYAQNDEPSGAQLDWIRANGLAFTTVEAGHGFDDLMPLKKVIGDARIVGLGEATHGSREIFQMKHRMLEFLACEMGFSIFSIEANMPECQRLNAYVLGGEGDPKELISGMYFWTWNTQEVLAMVEWMRTHNAAGKGHLQFTGFDMQYPDVARSNVRAFLEERDPEDRLELRVALSKLASVRSEQGSNCAVVATLPIDTAAGKRTEIRAHIKTEGLEGGNAAIWCCVLGPSRKVIANRSLAQRGPRGTTDWERYEIEVDIPESAASISFGLSVNGRGRAWFDSLEVLLDGEVHDDPTVIDPGFEAEKLLGFQTLSRSYRATLDEEVVHSGAQSLLLTPIVDDEIDATPSREALRTSRRILRALRKQRATWTENGDAAQIDWAIQSARVLWQNMRLKATLGFGSRIRDECMADNVAWLLEHNPGARIVLWAHNGHIARKRYWMGHHLSQRFGEDYLPVAFATHSGQYRAKSRQQPGRWVHDLELPGPGSVEGVLKAMGEERWILDWRSARAEDPASAWLTGEPMMRHIGAVAMDSQFAMEKVVEDFDLLIWIERSSASVSLIEGH